MPTERPTPPNDISNKQLAISEWTGIAALWVTIIGAVIVGAVAWGQAQADIGDAKSKAEANGLKIESIQRDVGAIKTDVEVTKNEIRNLGEKLERSVQQQDEILRILRSHARRD